MSCNSSPREPLQGPQSSHFLKLLQQLRNLNRDGEEETRCDSMATGAVFTGTGAPSAAAMYTLTPPAPPGWRRERTVAGGDGKRRDLWVFTRLLSLLKSIKPTGGEAGTRERTETERRIGRESGRRCRNGATEGDGDERRDGQKWMEGEQPLCNLSQHGTVSKWRERQNQTPPVWKMCTEMTDPDVKIWSSLYVLFLDLCGGSRPGGDTWTTRPRPAGLTGTRV